MIDARYGVGNPSRSTHTIVHEATHMLSYVNSYRYEKIIHPGYLVGGNDC